MIDIRNLDKAAVLKALYDASHCQGLGYVHKRPGPMTMEDAQFLIDANRPTLNFDYVHGRVMKVRLCNDSFDERLFDRDNYPGAAADAIRKLRSASQ